MPRTLHRGSGGVCGRPSLGWARKARMRPTVSAVSASAVDTPPRTVLSKKLKNGGRVDGLEIVGDGKSPNTLGEGYGRSPEQQSASNQQRSGRRLSGPAHEIDSQNALPRRPTDGRLFRHLQCSHGRGPRFDPLGPLPSEGKGHTFESCRVRQFFFILQRCMGAPIKTPAPAHSSE